MYFINFMYYFNYYKYYYIILCFLHLKQLITKKLKKKNLKIFFYKIFLPVFKKYFRTTLGNKTNKNLIYK